MLLVDDSDECRASSRRLLESLGYDVADFDGATPALDAAARRRPDVALFDVRMPGIDGFELARQYRSTICELTPIVMLTALDDLETRVRAIDAGASDVLVKPAERRLLDVRLRTLLERRERVEMLTACQQIAIALNKAVETKSRFTSGHARRTSLWAARMGGELGFSVERLAILEAGGLLHDVGKIGVPDAILEKTSALTSDERELMKTHPRLGEMILKAGNIDPVVAACARSHHERMDGRGYPDGIPLATLPMEVRIIQVADAFDALTSHRPYRRGSSPEDAAEALQRGVDLQQFDPVAVDLLVRLVERHETLHRR